MTEYKKSDMFTDGEALARDVLRKAGLPDGYGPFIRNAKGDWLPLPVNHQKLSPAGVLATLPDEFVEHAPISLVAITEFVRDRPETPEWRAAWVLFHARACRIAMAEGDAERACSEALRFGYMMSMLRYELAERRDWR